MTLQLRIALYVEGSTDQRFLPKLVRRTVEEILTTGQKIEIGILEPEIIEPQNLPKARAKAILEVAKEASKYDILIVHSDVDNRGWQKAYEERFEKGFNLVKQTKQENPEIAIVKYLVPLLPERMMEAWILSDPKTLIKVIGTSKNETELGLPKVNEVARRSDPKTILENAVREAIKDRPQRRRKQGDISGIVGSIYASMGEQIDLKQLLRLTSYQKFVDDLSGVLRELDIIT